MSLGKSSATANARPYSAHVEATSSRDDLFEMCAEGDIDGLKAMVLRGANVHEVDRDGNLLTHTAAKNDRLEILKWLVREKHVNINAVRKYRKPDINNSKLFLFLIVLSSQLQIYCKDCNVYRLTHLVYDFLKFFLFS